MKKKIVFLYICIIIIILAIIGISVIVFTNNKETKEENIDIWNFIKYETYDGTGNKIDNPYTIKPFSLMFYKEKVEVCYDKCYPNTYTKKDNTLTINDSEYFSGKFTISYKDNTLILKNDAGEAGSLVYYFKTPKEK